jgi:heterodisulfide reductase subunit B
MKGYIYYPGCSAKSNAKHYEESILPVFKELGMPLEEMNDWNCCGATAYFSVDDGMGAAICGRNLSIAEKINKDIIAPCAGCFLTLKKSNKFLTGGSEKARQIHAALDKAGCSYDGKVEVKHPLQILVQDDMLDKIRAKVVRPLKGLKVACYYGCQVVRPFTDFDSPDYPMSLDRLIAAIGAEPVDYSAKTRCCGGSLTGTIEEVGLRLNYILLKEAKRKGADVVATICPLCHFNLEILQHKMLKKYKDEVTMPIIFFSQLMGLAMGIPKEDLGFSRSIIDLKPMWEKLGNGGQK